MRITFIENRGKTAFWEQIARQLRHKYDHDVSWIVQNPVYKPSREAGRLSMLPFPSGKPSVTGQRLELLSFERGRRYFRTGETHYGWYRDEIARALDTNMTDVVIGEPTLFHELITVDECRRRGIPYLHPTMTRYPGGRFSIFEGDTQLPAASSDEHWSDMDIEELAQRIGTGASRPSYMSRPSRLESVLRQSRLAAARARTTGGWLFGERFNTPSPARKYSLQRRLAANLDSWTGLARQPDRGEGPVVLYPLQMQPEANIDVWGRPFSDQTEVIRRIAETLPVGGQVAVKSNPKSKYEVSDELLELAGADKRVLLLPSSCSMDEAHSFSIGAVTVSGTVGLEAVFGRGRCISLRHPILQERFPAFHADSPEEATLRLLDEPGTGRGGVESGKRLLSQIIAESFEGTINEPLYDPACVDRENIEKVAFALDYAITNTMQKERAA